MGPWHDHEPLTGTGEHLGDVEHVLGLEAEVEFLDDGLGEQLDQRRRIGQCGDRDATHQQGRDPRHGRDVRAGPWRRRSGAGPSPPPVRRSAAWPRDLGDGRRCDGGAVERGEDLARGRPRSSSSVRRTVAKGSGGDPVAKQPEFLDQLLGKDPLAGRDDLSELDVGRAQPLECGSQPSGQPGPGCGVPRSRAAQPSRAEPSRTPTAATRSQGGVRWRADQLAGQVPPPGVAERRCRRAASAGNRHGIDSGSTVHGPSGVNAPMARSGRRGFGRLRCSVMTVRPSTPTLGPPVG